MKLWLVTGETLADDFTYLIAARSLTDEQAERFIIREQRKEDKYFDNTEINYFERFLIEDVTTITGKKYNVQLFKKGGLYEFVRRFNPTR